MAASINTLRKHIADLQAERADLQRITRSPSEVRKAIEAWARNRHDQAMARVDRALRYVADGNSVLGALSARPLMRPDDPEGAASLALALLGPDVLADAMLRRLAEAVPEGMDSRARAARLAEIADELDRLEVDEERLIEASEAAGAPIQRRPDARPEIVLRVPEA